MNNFFTRIITASAGTGKTYRLSLEYISLVLHYYRAEEFRLDNILVLTFTRKATAEIRERIFSHIKTLTEHDPKNEADKKSLIKSLRERIKSAEDMAEESLSAVEEGILISVLHEISSQQHLLQIMTIDSYISSIFRNLIRPLRSIDTYQIDEQAIEKRLPYLMDFLMGKDFRQKMDSLLRRKVSPSLDEYKSFFISLIRQRWLHYMITTRSIGAGENSLCRHFLDPASWQEKAEAELQEAKTALSRILYLIEEKTLDKADNTPEKHLKSDIKNSFNHIPESFVELEALLEEMLSDPEECRKLYKNIKKGKFWLSKDFPKKTCMDELIELDILWTTLVNKLANYLVFSLQLPEQAEVISIWGKILAEYDKLIYRYKNMTYDDISWFTFEALYSEEPPLFNPLDDGGTNEFYHFLSHRSRFILIDEFQDTSLLQFNILQPIIREVISGEGTKPFGGLIVVGDEKQSIFGWRGGERELLLNLEEIFQDFQHVETDSLQESWRSSSVVMEIINSIFSDKSLHAFLAGKGMNWKYSPIRSCMPKLDPFSFLQLKVMPWQKQGKNAKSTLDDVYRKFIREMVLPYIKKGERIAILCRKGKELNELQAILDESETGSIFQPSTHLLEHRLIKALINWLRFLAYSDYLQFLAFLRSDYVLLHSDQLKSVINAISLYQNSKEAPADPDFSDIPLAESLYQLSKKQSSTSIYHSCMQIIEICLVDKMLSERDSQNLHAFLSVISDYEINHNEAGRSIPAFLTYLDENISQDMLRQRSVESSETLELQTIHKAKGLQYDRVFVFYNLSSRGSDNERKLSSYLDYQDKAYENLRDFAITVHYDDILEHSDFGRLVQIDERRSQLEELNTLYVAFTRAKTRLHISFAYEGSVPWDQYFSERGADKLSLPILLCDACVNYMQEKAEFSENRGWTLGDPAAVEAIEEKDKQIANSVSMQLRTPDWKLDNLLNAKANSESNSFDTKENWLFKRSSLFGSIAHYYLSYLHYNTRDEQIHAKKQCIRNYGSLLPVAELSEYLERLDTSIKRCPHIFSMNYDKIFAEFSIFDGKRVYRIDRLMIDSKAKKAVICDYKTGGIYDSEQLKNYCEILAKMPIIAEGGYEICAEYVEI